MNSTTLDMFEDKADEESAQQKTNKLDGVPLK